MQRSTIYWTASQGWNDLRKKDRANRLFWYSQQEAMLMRHAQDPYAEIYCPPIVGGSVLPTEAAPRQARAAEGSPNS